MQFRYSDNAAIDIISCSTILYATILYDLQRYCSDNVAITIEMQQCYSDNAAKYSIIFCLRGQAGDPMTQYVIRGG